VSLPPCPGELVPLLALCHAVRATLRCDALRRLLRSWPRRMASCRLHLAMSQHPANSLPTHTQLCAPPCLTLPPLWPSAPLSLPAGLWPHARVPHAGAVRRGRARRRLQLRDHGRRPGGAPGGAARRVHGREALQAGGDARDQGEAARCRPLPASLPRGRPQPPGGRGLLAGGDARDRGVLAASPSLPSPCLPPPPSSGGGRRWFGFVAR
jgi:hypothetical protein